MPIVDVYLTRFKKYRVKDGRKLLRKDLVATSFLFLKISHYPEHPGNGFRKLFFIALVSCSKTRVVKDTNEGTLAPF